ncbi:type II toxin-antitoxin system RelE/ParE family toxin [Chitinophaga sp.]|uniref:type II toxin-antitoxin system RelE/ParE family toxin n=1 Tax=Chitinophaga sp. TaxID=1869181 RepID=UPI0031E49536
MVKGPLKVVIENTARQSLLEAYHYIRKDSPKNAEKVKAKLLASMQALSKNPEMHPPDKYRQNNDGAYRAYEIYKYRITYHVSDSQITILRVRHTKMNPRSY